MTFLQIGVPLGVVLGYILTSLIKDSLGWIYAFIIQSIISTILMIITLFIPNKYFSATHHAKKRNSIQERSRNYSIDTLYYEHRDDLNNKEKGIKLFCSKFLKLLTYKVYYHYLK